MFLLPIPLRFLIEIDGADDWWEATDPECAFRLLPSTAGLPAGWTRLTVPMQTPRDQEAVPLFRVDTGSGYRPLPVTLPGRYADGCWSFVIHVPAGAVALSFSPGCGLGPLCLRPLGAKAISRSALVTILMLSLGKRWMRDPPLLLRTGRDLASAWKNTGSAGFRAAASSALVNQDVSAGVMSATDRYARWIADNERISRTPLPHVACRFSVLIPVGRNQAKPLAATLATLKAQGGSTWNCLIGLAPGVALPKRMHDGRTACIRLVTAERGAMLAELGTKADGDMLLVLDPGDRLVPGALGALAAHPDAGVVHGDEDRIGSDGRRCSPFLKPEWSPDLLHAFNYFGRPAALRRTWVERVGGFNAGTGAGAEWDLHLRMTTAAAPVVRVPRVLCHRRADSDQDRPVMHQLVTMPEKAVSGQGGQTRPSQGNASRDRPPQDRAGEYRAVMVKHWARLGMASKVTSQPDGTQRSVLTMVDPPLVSIIIPNSGPSARLTRCLQNIEQATDYPRTEVVVVDSGSIDPSIAVVHAGLSVRQRIEILSRPDDHNVAAARNAGAWEARGELLLFLDSDIEFPTPDWLMELVQFALRPGVGVVGTMLTSPDGMLRHAGVTIGMQLCGPLFHGAAETDWGPIGSAMVPRTLSAVAGACQMVRREVFAQTGGFDEAYTTVNSEIALCLAARAAGWRVVYTPFAGLIQRAYVGPGHCIGSEDTMRTAAAIRRFGYEQDPFFHPALDAGSAVPRLRMGGELSNAASLRRTLHQYRASWERVGALDLGNDADVAAAVGMPITAVMWPPQPGNAIDDQWSAVRWCVDLLRRRPDLRQRFPDALSAGAAGAFATWVDAEGSAQFGLTVQARKHIHAALAGAIAATARQAVLTDAKLVGPMAVAFLPIGRSVLLRFLLQRDQGCPRLEETWWLALSCAEDPARELVFSYRFNPSWQALFPDGLTIFGRDRFAAWLRAAYRCDDAWTRPLNWPVTLSPAEQIRIGWNVHVNWQEHHPNPFASAESARGLLDWLQSSSAGLLNGVTEWLASLSKAAIAEILPASGINVIAHFCYPSGLRTSALSVVQGLHASGYDVALRDVAVDVHHDTPNHAAFDGLELHDTTLLHIQPEPFFLEAFDRAGLHPRQRRTYRIGYWYWELETVPKSWGAAVADVDEVWVATSFVGDALRASFDVPVFDLMPGVELPGFTRRPAAAFGIPPNRFTFLFVFHMMSIMERKNPLGLIRAFEMAFNAAEPVTLILKTSFGDKHPALIRQLHEAACRSGGRIMIIDQVFSSDETISLIDACDAYISLHRSEGLGLTMAEAMLLGKPVIATGYSGNLSFMNTTNSLLVEHRLVGIGKGTPLYECGSLWADPSEAHAARLMRQVWENPDAAADLGARARADIQTRLSIAAAGQRMADRLAAIRVRRRVGQPLRDSDPALAMQFP